MENASTKDKVSANSTRFTISGTKRGTISRIMPKWKYGFIAPDEGGSIYFHTMGVIGNFDDLREGQSVEYLEEVDTVSVRKRAIGVTVI